MNLLLVGGAYGLAAGVLTVLYQIQQAIKKAHADIAARLEQQHCETMRLKGNVEALFYQLEAIRRQGETKD